MSNANNGRQYVGTKTKTTHKPVIKQLSDKDVHAMADFKSYSIPFMTVHGTLRCAAVQRLYARNYLLAAKKLFDLEAAMTFAERNDEGAAEIIQATMDGYLSTAEDELSQYAAQVAKAAADNGVDLDETMEYTKPYNVVYITFSPAAARVVTLLETCDKIVADIDKLWMHSVFDSTQRKKALYEAVGLARKTIGSLIGLAQRAINAHRRKYAGEKVGDSDFAGLPEAFRNAIAEDLDEETRKAAEAAEAKAPSKPAKKATQKSKPAANGAKKAVAEAT
jgi:hypothetical protein